MEATPKANKSSLFLDASGVVADEEQSHDQMRLMGGNDWAEDRSSETFDPSRFSGRMVLLFLSATLLFGIVMQAMSKVGNAPTSGTLGGNSAVYNTNHISDPNGDVQEPLGRSELSQDVVLYFKWLTNRQSPESCEASHDGSKFRRYMHHAGFGSIVQVWKNSFLKSINHDRIMLSGFPTAFSNPKLCPNRELESCVVQPISTCKVKGTEVSKIKKEFASCAVAFPIERITKESGMSKMHSLAWFHAQTMRYLLRPRKNVVKLIDQIKETLGLTDMSRVLGVHVRHGDLGTHAAQDNRKPAKSAKFGRLATTMAYWNRFDVILVGSDDPGAVDVIANIVKSRETAPGAHPIRVVTFPEEMFEIQPKAGKVMYDVLKQTHKKNHGGAVSEDVGLLSEMFIMSQCGGFLGAVTSNFARTVYELAGGPESNQVYVDVKGQPYYGCEYESKWPRGSNGQDEGYDTGFANDGS